jgi:DNA-binding MarR family transcriptional regulator
VNVSTPAVVKMSGWLVDAGLITRRRDERDNRLVRLWLTDAGRALQEPIESERRRLEQRITEDLTEAERRLSMSALTKVYRSATALLAESDSDQDSRTAPTRRTTRR